MGPPGEERLSLFDVDNWQYNGPELGICVKTPGVNRLLSTKNPPGMQYEMYHDISKYGYNGFVGPNDGPKCEYEYVKLPNYITYTIERKEIDVAKAEYSSPRLFGSERLGVKKEHVDYRAKIFDVNIVVKPEQKKFLTDNAIYPEPKSFDFYSDPNLVPPLQFMIDTQDVIRTFCGGPRSYYGYYHMSATWNNIRALSADATKLMKDLSDFVCFGPESGYNVPAELQAVYPKKSALNASENFPDIDPDGNSVIEASIFSDVPATMLASYFIRDFKPFDHFKQQPTGANIIGEFTQPKHWN